METRDVVIVGGGPAGLAAAVELYKQGIRDILIVEREKHPGGILRQCIHDGFGLARFHTTLSGPEYAARFIQEAKTMGIPCETDTTVLHISGDKQVTVVNEKGIRQIQAKAVILTMGCRERTRGAVGIPGERGGDSRVGGYRNDYGQAPDPGGRPCAGRSGDPAVSRRASQKHRAVP